MRLTRRQALAVALICGVLAAILSVLYLRPRSAPQAPPKPKQVAVVVAATDLPVATRLTRDLIQTKKVPEDQVPEGAFTSAAEVLGKITVAEVRAGEVLTDRVVREPGAELGLSFIVPEGMRAVTVALDEVSGVAGLARPGDHVDVICTFDMPDQVSLSRIILQDVELLAVGTQLVPTEKKKAEGEKGRAPARKVAPTATLAVTPEDAEKLVLAATKGRIRLALRRAGDKSRAMVEGVTLYALTGYQPKETQAEGPPEQSQPQQPPPWYQPPPSQAPTGATKPKGPAVEVVRGTQREVVVP